MPVQAKYTFTIRGVTGTIHYLAKYFGVNKDVLKYRLLHSWDPEKAISVPSQRLYQPTKTYTFGGKEYTAKELGEMVGLSAASMKARINRANGNVEKAVSFPRKSKTTVPNQFTIDGFTGNIREIAAHFNMDYFRLLNRFKKTRDIQDAVSFVRSTKKTTKQKYTYQGFTGYLSAIIEHFDLPITQQQLNYLIREKDMSVEEAIEFVQRTKKPSPQKYTYQGFTGYLSSIIEHFDLPITQQQITYPIKKKDMSAEEAIEYQLNRLSRKTSPDDMSTKECSLSSHQHDTPCDCWTCNQYTYKGFTGSLSDILHHFKINLSATAVRTRMKRGMSLEEALETPKQPTRQSKVYTYQGFTGSLSDILHHFKINLSATAVRTRMKRGMSLEEALETPKQPTRQSKVYTYQGFTGSLFDILHHFKINLSATAVRARMKHGMSLEDALGTPKQPGCPQSKIYTYQGFTGSIQQILAHFPSITVSSQTARVRLRKGASIEEALETPVSPVGNRKEYSYQGITGHISTLAEHFGIPESAVSSMRKILNEGKSIDFVMGTFINKYSPHLYEYEGVTGTFSELCDYFRKSKSSTAKLMVDGLSFQEAIAAADTDIHRHYIEFMGVRGTISHVCKVLGYNTKMVQKRIAQGYSIEEAFLVPLPFVKYTTLITHQGGRHTIREIAEMNNVDFVSLYNLIMQNRSIEYAVAHALPAKGT